MREYFLRLKKALWITFFILTPLTFIALLSQNSIPGDALYMAKRGFEEIGLTAFSIIPETKADYTIELANNRFNEAEKMIITKSEASGLKNFLIQVEKSKNEINSISNPEQKDKLQQKLISSIDSYKHRLEQIQTQVAVKSGQDTANMISRPLEFAEPTTYKTSQSPKATQAQDTPTKTLSPTEAIINSINDTEASLDEIKKSIEPRVLPSKTTKNLEE